jgi:glycosyltransferase involved in cell wall biosynthesis
MGFGIRTRLRRWRQRDAINDEYLEAREVTSLLREPAAPLVPRASDGPLHVAVVVPFFPRGSGGHMTIANLVRGLERLGHRCSLWIDDPGRRCAGGPAQAEADFRAWFGPFQAPVRYGFEGWDGADVVVATGWQTVARVRVLGGAAARAYLVQDHEPEFFGTSAQRLWAQDSYRHGLYPITAGPWLADVMGKRYGLAATHFDLAVDTELYCPQPVERRDDVVLFYARASTPRRAVPIALVALGELKRRRPEAELWFYGHGWPPQVDYPFSNLGSVGGPELARLYSTATVGLVLSMTNYSLVPQEMLACGLPCVELDSPSVAAAFGRDGPVELAAPEPLAIAAAIERLLDDPALRERRARTGAAFVETKTWDAAARQVETGLRAALAAAEAGAYADSR